MRIYSYTYPAEGAFSDITHARKVYSALVKRLLRNGTTSAVLYGSNHLEATKELADICSDAGIRAFVGKTCADINTPDYYVEETGKSISQTELFIQYVREKWGNDKDTMVYPVVTPRFVRSSHSFLVEGLNFVHSFYRFTISLIILDLRDSITNLTIKLRKSLDDMSNRSQLVQKNFSRG